MAMLPDEASKDELLFISEVLRANCPLYEAKLVKSKEGIKIPDGASLMQGFLPHERFSADNETIMIFI
jgi:hypothetical protein